ncbi:unnamed protein product [Mucor hiemalis]
MSCSDDGKQKRNKPCENCRTHRRKCKVSQGSQCERCVKMNLTCVFKFSVKPTVLKKAVPNSKKSRMLEQVRILEQEMAAMEQQLRQLNVEVHLDSPNTVLFNSNESIASHTSNLSTFYDSDSNSSIYSSSGFYSDCECTDPTRCVHSEGSKRIKYEAKGSPRLSPSSSTSTALTTITSQNKTNNSWQLTVKQGPKGISFQTSIRNFAMSPFF